MKIFFSELTKLNPTVISTVLKMNEEIGELNREVLKFIPYKDCNKKFIATSPEATFALEELIGELLDVGQTTATMMFVMDKLHGIGEYAIERHLKKLHDKGYTFDETKDYSLKNEAGELQLVLPELLINTNLMQTCLKIGEEAGELSQLVGKFSAMSGEEQHRIDEKQLNIAIVQELLDVAQCCVTMLYTLVDKYGIDVDAILTKHRNKLHEHGYC